LGSNKPARSANLLLLLERSASLPPPELSVSLPPLLARSASRPLLERSARQKRRRLEQHSRGLLASLPLPELSASLPLPELSASRPLPELSASRRLGRLVLERLRPDFLPWEHRLLGKQARRNQRSGLDKQAPPRPQTRLELKLPERSGRGLLAAPVRSARKLQERSGQGPGQLAVHSARKLQERLANPLRLNLRWGGRRGHLASLLPLPRSVSKPRELLLNNLNNYNNHSNRSCTH